jgi:hypothetical protein
MFSSTVENISSSVESGFDRSEVRLFAMERTLANMERTLADMEPYSYVDHGPSQSPSFRATLQGGVMISIILLTLCATGSMVVFVLQEVGGHNRVRYSRARAITRAVVLAYEVVLWIFFYCTRSKQKILVAMTAVAVVGLYMESRLNTWT